MPPSVQGHSERTDEGRRGHRCGLARFEGNQDHLLVPVAGGVRTLREYDDRSARQDVRVGNRDIRSAGHRHDVDEIAFAQQFAHPGVREPDRHHPGVVVAGCRRREAWSHQSCVHQDFTVRDRTGERVTHSVRGVGEGACDKAGSIAIGDGEVVGGENAPRIQIPRSNDDGHAFRVRIAAQRKDYRENGEKCRACASCVTGACPARPQSFGDPVGQGGLQRAEPGRARPPGGGGPGRKRKRTDGHEPTLCVRVSPPVSRKVVGVGLGIHKPPVEKSGQLAAAAGAEDVLDEEVLEEELLDEEVLDEDPAVSALPDLDSVFALSLAVLPLRESVR